MFADPTASLAFLTSLHSRLSHPYPPPNETTKEPTQAPPPPAAEAYALSLSSIAYGKLLLGDLKGTKQAIDESEKLLEGLDGVDGIVWAGFYGVSGDYYKVSSPLGRTAASQPARERRWATEKLTPFGDTLGTLFR